MRQTARAIILDEHNRLLVFERKRRQNIVGKIHHYYSIPGGGIEAGETPEQAVIRELREEMSVTIEPLRLIVHQINEVDDREHFYFLARIVSGVPKFNIESEEARLRTPFVTNSYTIAWAQLDDPKISYYRSYAQVSRYVIDCLRDGFPLKPVDMRIEKK